MLILPDHYTKYIEEIYQRCRLLISTQIWHGIDDTTLSLWIKNFETPEERYFSAWILDSMTYRSNAQTVAMIHQLFEQVLPSVAWRNHINLEDNIEWLDYLQKAPITNEENVVIVPVIRDNDPPTKSGPLISRIICRSLGINDHHILWPNQLIKKLKNEKSPIKTVIFVDDFVGTGRQFVNFIKDNNLNEHIKNLNCIYLPFVAHQKGINYIKNKYSNILLGCAEKLTNDLDFFSEGSRILNDGINTTKSARLFYMQLLRKIGFSNPAIRQGFGRLGLTYSFQHATPNNSLPLLWWTGNNWNPLFKR